MTFSVFETLLVIDGKPVEAEGHIQRLHDVTGIDATAFLRISAAELTGYHRLRIDFTPPESLTATPSVIPKPSLFNDKFIRFHLATKQLRDQQLNAGYGSFKIAARQDLEVLESQTAPALPLLMDGSGDILETTRHNVFIVEGKSLVTPPLDGRILPGVTRKAVIKEAVKLGLICREEPVSLKRAQAASGLFLTNAIVGIGFVDQCDQSTWHKIPVITQALHKILAEKWQPRLKPK